MKQLRQIIPLSEARDPEKAVKLFSYIVDRRRRQGIVQDNKNIVPKSPYDDSNFEKLKTIGRSFYKTAEHVPETEHVPVNRIKTTQYTIGIHELKQKIKHEWEDHNPKYPIVIATTHQGKEMYHLIDGNHRVAAARIRKDPTIEVKVLRQKQSDE